jgi:CRP/FNR family cyclic AMP-dependent transcriptional regulator
VGSKQLKAMMAPSGLKIGGNCAACKLRKQKFFCNLSPSGIRALDTIRSTAGYRKGAVLFVKGQLPRGAFVLCKGRAKLSVGTIDGKSIILGIAQAGEVLGLAAAVSDTPYEATAEALEPCQVSFLKRNALLHLMRQQNEFCLRIAEYLSEKYRSACQEIRVRSVPQLAGEKLAKLLMGWAVSNGATREPRCIRLIFTHEEIAEMIGTTRETVTRLLSDLKRKGMIQQKGSMLVIRDRVALDALAAPARQSSTEGPQYRR